MMNSEPCILSVDAGGTSLKAAIVRGHSIIENTFFTIPVHSDGNIEDIRLSYNLLGKTARQLECLHRINLARTTVCIPGPFDYLGGCCMMTHKYQAVYGLSLRPWIEEGFGRSLPIHFLHDSTAFLLGACMDIPSQSYRRLCGTIIGTGLGFAAMIDGEIMENPSGGPEISIFRNPYLSKTAEDYISKRGILARYHQLVPECDNNTDVKDIASLALLNDCNARQVFNETGTHLASVLLPVIRKYHFELLFLGGGISKSADLFIPSLKKGLAQVSIDIRPTRDPDLAPVLGATQYSFY